MRKRSFLASMLRPLAVLAALGLRPAVAADALAPTDLAGWWMAVDEVQPLLWTTTFPAEELLIIDPAGTAETRFMNFVPLNVTACADVVDSCSDAPARLRSRFTIAGDLLAFQTPTRIGTGASRDDRRLPSSATSTPVWRASLSGGGAVLFLDHVAGAAPRRIFAHVDPVRLGRLRAGIFELPTAIIEGWRCYLARATSGDPAFLPIYRGDSAPPAWFDDYLTAASYRETLRLVGSMAWADGTDPELLRLLAAPLDPVLAEHFPDLAPPKTRAESQLLNLKFIYLHARAEGLDDADAQALIADRAKGQKVALGIGEEAIAALARTKTDPDFQKMLACR